VAVSVTRSRSAGSAGSGAQGPAPWSRLVFPREQVGRSCVGEVDPDERLWGRHL